MRKETSAREIEREREMERKTATAADPHVGVALYRLSYSGRRARSSKRAVLWNIRGDACLKEMNPKHINGSKEKKEKDTN